MVDREHDNTVGEIAIELAVALFDDLLDLRPPFGRGAEQRGANESP